MRWKTAPPCCYFSVIHFHQLELKQLKGNPGHVYCFLFHGHISFTWLVQSPTRWRRMHRNATRKICRYTKDRDKTYFKIFPWFFPRPVGKKSNNLRIFSTGRGGWNHPFSLVQKSLSSAVSVVGYCQYILPNMFFNIFLKGLVEVWAVADRVSCFFFQDRISLRKHSWDFLLRC